MSTRNSVMYLIIVDGIGSFALYRFGPPRHEGEAALRLFLFFYVIRPPNCVAWKNFAIGIG